MFRDIGVAGTDVARLEGFELLGGAELIGLKIVESIRV